MFILPTVPKVHFWSQNSFLTFLTWKTSKNRLTYFVQIRLSKNLLFWTKIVLLVKCGIYFPLVCDRQLSKWRSRGRYVKATHSSGFRCWMYTEIKLSVGEVLNISILSTSEFTPPKATYHTWQPWGTYQKKTCF